MLTEFLSSEFASLPFPECFPSRITFSKRKRESVCLLVWFGRRSARRLGRERTKREKYTPKRGKETWGKETCSNIDFTRGRVRSICILKPAPSQMNAIEQYPTLTTIKIFITSFIGFLICSPTSNQLLFSSNV
ncbi:hypothetical protein NPIL_43791 [Nephila pilipes]|uniref:Uncharacterized protein n=1 Tax=Nephila pilipes TaxID=299642 RepID=A0A8X6TNI0_NEPPI|nr:hypothetical protein NPIL_43791 [Nephila pilipes]